MTRHIQTPAQAIEHATRIAISGALEEAVQHFQKALQHFGYRPDLLTNLGLTYARLGRSDEAVHALKNALLLNPRLKEAHLNLGLTFLGQNRYEDASASFYRVLEIFPEDSAALDGLGLVAHQLGYLQKAQALYERAVAADARNEQAKINLANCLLENLQASQALEILRSLIQPGCSGTVISNYLMALQYSDQASAQTILEETRRVRQLACGGARYPAWAAPAPEASARPRVGLVSGDFKAHPVGWFLKGVIPHLARSFDLVAYANQTSEDHITAALKPHMHAWHNIAGLSDAQACQLMRQAGLHLLIDLSGYTAGHRLEVFERRGAPLQASWLGYFGTTGVSQMDFILMDGEHAPHGHQPNFTEQIIHLDPIRMCFSPPAYAGSISPAPCLRNGLITFGSFNNTAKITDRTVALWASCMHAVPNSRMLLKWKTLVEPSTKNRLRQMFGFHGINPARLYFQSASAHDAMLEEYSEVDIALDTLPFTGGTTTCEALWMGVPVVTCRGDRPVSRQSAAMLSVVGLGDLVSDTADGFVEIVTRLSSQPQNLNEMRLGMRERLLRSSLFDPQRFSQSISAALHQILESRKSLP